MSGDGDVQRPFRFGRPGPVGERFRRALTDAEMTAVLERTAAEGGVAGFVAMWDVILGEAEGMTMAEASDRNAQLDLTAYAIPYEQAELLTTAMRKARKGRRGADAQRWAKQVAWTWFDIGPATYDNPWGSE